MSKKSNTTATAASAGTSALPAGAVSLKASNASSAATGDLVIIRPSELAASGRTGIVAQGVLEKIVPNKFNEAKNDYLIRGSDNTLYILNETQSIKEQLGQDGILGMTVAVVYNGKEKTKSGRGFHNFEVFSIPTTNSAS